MIRFLSFIIFSMIILSPIVAIGIHAFIDKSDIFIFLKDNVLSDYILNSLVLCVYTIIGSCVIAIPSAWVVVRYVFFAKNIIEIMLLLPMAFPAYIVAYAYTDLLGETTNIPIRSLGGATFILTLCFYPYIYLFARTAFLKQIKNQNQIESAAMLGATKTQQFFQIILPNARPFIMVGIALVMMEVLSDYGTVSYFNIKVFSTGIYNAWAGYGDSIAAARLGLILLVFVFLIIFLEKNNRSKMKFFNTETEIKNKNNSIKLNYFWSFIISVLCALPILFGFIIPLILLGKLALADFENRGIYDAMASTIPYLKNTVALALGVSSITIILSYCFCAILRSSDNKIMMTLSTLSNFGYAIPGVILGLGLLILSNWATSATNIFLSGSLFFLAIGYIIRFWTIPTRSIEAGFEKISPNIDHAATLARNNRYTEFWYIRLPLLWPSILSGFLILSVEIVKELPLTLMLRPFDYNTLAIQAYHLASDERLTQAALPSIIIAICGLIPVIILARLIKRP